MGDIPCVDFSALGLQNPDRTRLDPKAVQQIVDELHSAFTSVGFVYLKNYGISHEQVK